MNIIIVRWSYEPVIIVHRELMSHLVNWKLRMLQINRILEIDIKFRWLFLCLLINCEALTKLLLHIWMKSLVLTKAKVMRDGNSSTIIKYGISLVIHLMLLSKSHWILLSD